MVPLEIAFYLRRIKTPSSSDKKRRNGGGCPHKGLAATQARYDSPGFFFLLELVYALKFRKISGRIKEKIGRVS